MVKIKFDNWKNPRIEKPSNKIPIKKFEYDEKSNQYIECERFDIEEPTVAKGYKNVVLKFNYKKL